MEKTPKPFDKSIAEHHEEEKSHGTIDIITKSGNTEKLNYEEAMKWLIDTNPKTREEKKYYEEIFYHVQTLSEYVFHADPKRFKSSKWTEDFEIECHNKFKEVENEPEYDEEDQEE